MPSEAWELALEGSVKLPTGDEELLYGSGSTDLGLQLLAARYFDRSCLHLALGVSHLGEAEVLSVPEQELLAATLTWERALGRSLSFVAQITAADSPFEELAVEDLEEASFLIDLGFKKGLGRRFVLFLAATQNFVTFGSSADFGLHAGITGTL